MTRDREFDGAPSGAHPPPEPAVPDPHDVDPSLLREAAESLELHAAGATTVVNLPISSSQIAAAGTIEFRSELVNPSGVTDQVPTNNRRASTLSVPGKTSSSR